jgi:hypothetical protein
VQQSLTLARIRSVSACTPTGLSIVMNRQRTCLERLRREAIREYATRLKQTKRYKNVDAFKENVAPLGEVVSRIVHNGGHVVFLRLPAAGPRLQMEETAFPTAVYFNALAQATSAEWIDFRSLSHYQDFDCPDGSHLSPRGSQRLSRSLVAELTRRRLLPQGRGEVKVNGDGQVH